MLTGQYIARKLVANHGYRVTSVFRVDIPLDNSLLNHPACSHEVRVSMAWFNPAHKLIDCIDQCTQIFAHTLAPQEGPFPKLSSLRQADINLEDFDCVVHNLGILFGDEYHPRGFQKMANTMQKNFQQRQILTPTLGSQLEEELEKSSNVIPETWLQQKDDIGKIPAEPQVFDSRNRQSALDFFESYLDRKKRLAALYTSHKAPRPTVRYPFVYISPERLLSPFRQAGVAMESSMLKDRMLQLCPKSVSKPSKTPSKAETQQVARPPTVRPIFVETGT